ncbi:MAG: hypothetical protein ACI4RH_04135 [Huintestinicola sp.]
MVNEQVTTIELAAGTPEEVKFAGSYPYYWVINMSDSEVYAAVNRTPEADADGTYTIAAGEKLRISGGVNNSSITLLGEGKVQVIASVIATPPFVAAKRGGDTNLTMGTFKGAAVSDEVLTGTIYEEV